MIYIGNFVHMTNQEEIQEEERRHGEFNLIVQAENHEQAVDMFEKQIIEFRKKTEFFAGQCKIFFVQLVEVDRIPDQRPIMLNFKSVVGDPNLPHIHCSFPSRDSDGCSIYDWKDDRLKIDDRFETVFLEFDA